MRCIQKWTIRLAVFALALGISAAQAEKAPKSDAEIKQEIIKQSIAGLAPSLALIAPAEVAGGVAHTTGRAVPLRFATGKT